MEFFLTWDRYGTWCIVLVYILLVVYYKSAFHRGFERMSSAEHANAIPSDGVCSIRTCVGPIILQHLY